MDPIYYNKGEYIVTSPSANIIADQIMLYGADNVLVGGLVRCYCDRIDICLTSHRQCSSCKHHWGMIETMKMQNTKILFLMLLTAALL